MAKPMLPQAVEDCHQLLLWIIPHLDKMPRQRRFTVGERIENQLLHVLSLLIQSAYSRDKRRWLDEANQCLAVLRHLWRLAFELHVVSLKSYEYGARKLMDLGRQVGGWRKEITQQESNAG